MEFPERLVARLEAEADGGAAWRARLPGVLERLRETWEVTFGDPIHPGGVASLVLPAWNADREDLIVKIPVPDPEVVGEPAALARVGGEGAIQLLAFDAESASMLLEAADPHRSLLSLNDAEQATSISVELLRQWWKAGSTPPTALLARRAAETEPIPRLVDLAPRLHDELESRYHWLVEDLDRTIIDRALATYAEPDANADTLLHTDLHQANVLAAVRQPWLIIDPKPLFGEAAYDLEPLLRDFRPHLTQDPQAPPPADDAILRRFDAITAELKVDRERAADWVIARSTLLGSLRLEFGDPYGRRQLRVAELVHRR